MQRRVLIADDSSITREQLRELLAADPGLEVDTVANGQAALDALADKNYSLFLTDLKMPHMDGMELIERIQQQRVPVTVIVMTGFGSIDQAVQAIRLGAYDFLTKPIDPDHLRLVIERALSLRKMQDELGALRERLQEQYSFQDMLSKSPRMHQIFELINHVAETTSTVLIHGETGTGKERVAEAIHKASAGHRKGEMVAVNCAAFNENLLESELFGHEKGAFTTAIAQRKGRFEQANGGTIFLDEVGDIPLSMQVKLLRVLQERRFERVGGSVSIEVDVRVIAATNRSLLRLIKEGKFREDLYYRLNVVQIDLPPLRDRMEDVPLLATHFAAKYAPAGQAPKGISPAAMEWLLAHSWPGNIRELENAIERACVTARGANIEEGDLPATVLKPQRRPSGLSVDLNRPLAAQVREMTAELERVYLLRALKKTHGNVGRCAKLAGLSRRSISAKLAEYQIDKDKFKQT
jgi:DNA-binding NtrC family response regulator